MTPSRRNAVLAILAGSALMTATPATQSPVSGLGVPGGQDIFGEPGIGVPQFREDTFTALLAAAESSRDHLQMNKGGYAGLFQMGEAAAAIAGVYDPGAPLSADDTRNRWRGTFHIPGYPEVRTIGDFLDTPAAQITAFRMHLAYLDREIGRRGLNRYIGGYVAAVPITWDGLRAMMHLGGPDGTERFIATGGLYDPADDNGVRISDYGRRFAGFVTIQPTRPPVSPTLVVPTLVAITPTRATVTAPKRQRGARRRPLPETESEPRISAWRTGSSGGRRPCRTSCARPRAGRGSGSREP